MNAFRGFVRKEALHILRDRRTLVVLLSLPVVAVLLFGFAIRTDVDHVRIAVVDPVPDHATLELRARFSATGIFEVVAVLEHTSPLDALFQRGAVQQAIVFHPGFAERLGRSSSASGSRAAGGDGSGHGGASVLVITDATDPNTGAALQAYASGVIQAYERELAGPRGGIRIVPEVRMRFNPTMESAHLFVPGLIAFVLTIVCALMTAISITREKETGTMEVLLVSPLRPWQIIVGKVLPYLVLGFINTLTVLFLAWLVFAVPVNGSVLLLLGESLLYVLTALALGVLISSRTSSQRVAMIAALSGMLLPTLMLSGFIFPIESMPRVLQLISNIIPAKWFLLILRGIMLKGVGLEFLWRETLVLLGMTAFLLLVSVRRFSIRLA
jgi:ABC-2 type transport system permease protein